MNYDFLAGAASLEDWHIPKRALRVNNPPQDFYKASPDPRLLSQAALPKMFSKPLVFSEPWLYPQRGEGMAWLPAEPVRLAGQQQSPGAPPAQLPCRAPSQGHRGVPLPPFAHISPPQSHPLTWPSGLCAIQPCLPPTTSAFSLMFMKGCC